MKNGTTGQDTTRTASSTNDIDGDTTTFLPLHCNNKYIDFEKLSEFDLNFGSFSYKIDKFGRKTQRNSREAIRQAESRATNRIVAAIIDAGDNDQQLALPLHRSLVDARTRKEQSLLAFSQTIRWKHYHTIGTS
jgi:hypothetical protein